MIITKQAVQEKKHTKAQTQLYFRQKPCRPKHLPLMHITKLNQPQSNRVTENNIS